MGADTVSERKTDSLVSKKVTYRAGDSVSVRAGRFMRYGTVTGLFYDIDTETGRVTEMARIRFGHGTERVTLYLMSKKETAP